MQDRVVVMIRVPKKLRDDFKAVCRSRDEEMSQVLRKAMRRYVKRHKEGRQEDGNQF